MWGDCVSETAGFLLVGRVDCRVGGWVGVVSWVVVAVCVLAHCYQGDGFLLLVVRCQWSLLLVKGIHFLPIIIYIPKILIHHISIRKIILQILITQHPTILIPITITIIIVIKPHIPSTIILGILTDLENLITLQVIYLGLEVEFRDF